MTARPNIIFVYIGLMGKRASVFKKFDMLLLVSYSVSRILMNINFFVQTTGWQVECCVVHCG